MCYPPVWNLKLNYRSQEGVYWYRNMATSVPFICLNYCLPKNTYQCVSNTIWLYIIPVRMINAVIALRRKVALSSTAITVLTVYIRLIRCRTKKEVGDIVLSSTVPIIRESCIDGRWRNALNTGKDTKIVLAKRLSGCFAFQRK